jgi:hypothetical protein
MRPYINPPPDPNEPHQITIRTGKLFLVDHGNFIMLTSPIILNNGVVVTLEGLMRMPDGKTRTLSEGEYLF